MKEVKMAKWMNGLSKFVSKRMFEQAVYEVTDTGKFEATKNSFTNYSKNIKAGGWKNAVESIYGRNSGKVIDSIVADGFVAVTKSRFSKLG